MSSETNNTVNRVKQQRKKEEERNVEIEFLEKLDGYYKNYWTDLKKFINEDFEAKTAVINTEEQTVDETFNEVLKILFKKGFLLETKKSIL